MKLFMSSIDIFYSTSIMHMYNLIKPIYKKCLYGSVITCLNIRGLLKSILKIKDFLTWMSCHLIRHQVMRKNPDSMFQSRCQHRFWTWEFPMMANVFPGIHGITVLGTLNLPSSANKSHTRKSLIYVSRVPNLQMNHGWHIRVYSKKPEYTTNP